MNYMKVLKFGGSSVANAANIKKVAAIIANSQDKQWVIVSALGGITDQLLQIGYLASTGNEAT